MVTVYLRAFGRGPTRAKTYLQSEFLVCVLRDVFTKAEGTIIASGGLDQVEVAHKKVNEAFDADFVGVVERETGRPVEAHIAQIKMVDNLAIHLFLFDDVSSQAKAETRRRGPESVDPAP